MRPLLACCGLLLLTVPVLPAGEPALGHGPGVGRLWCIDITKKPTNKEKDLSPFSGPLDADPKFDPRDPRNIDSALVWHFGRLAPAGAARAWNFGRTVSTCAVADGVCYAADLDGRLFCLDALTGEKLWEHNLGAETRASPYVVDGKVYLGDEKGFVHIFSHDRLMKKKVLGKISMGKDARVRAPVLASNGVLYVVTENPCRLWAIAKR
jgi:hypothetical protein